VVLRKRIAQVELNAAVLYDPREGKSYVEVQDCPLVDYVSRCVVVFCVLVN